MKNLAIHFLLLICIVLLSPCVFGSPIYFLLLGQSNMAGRATMEYPADSMTVDGIYALDRTGTAIIRAQEPVGMNSPWESSAGYGLSMSFAKTLKDSIGVGGAEILLVQSSMGGSPSWRWLPDSSLFKKAVERARAAESFGYTCAGILWLQGEQDAYYGGDIAATYGLRLAAVVAGFRDSLGNVPFFAGHICEWETLTYPYVVTVNNAIDSLSAVLDSFYVVSSSGLTGRSFHFYHDSYTEFGQRYAQAVYAHW